MPLEKHQQSRVGNRVGVVKYRSAFWVGVRAWVKRSPLSPYWLDRRVLRGSVDTLVPHANGLLLDVGGSETPYRPMFEPHVRHYIGMDYPPALLAKQPEMWDLLYSVKHMVNLLADGKHLPIATDSVDTVLCTEVLEHVPEPARFLDEIGRVLKPGGKALVTVPFIQPLHELPYDFYRFTPSSLELFARNAGLEVESIEPRGNFASANGAMLSQWLTRSVGAVKRQTDGSVILSRWRSLLLIPVTALIQSFFYLASKVTNDETVCQGYALVARKPD
ncbi:MAG: methyltransferase domain-containing protein [Planctomycetota bacterium]